jgi:DEAD/DEAH box helicase domain-containing protein
VFARAPEPAVVNPANPFVLDPHLGCAAYEQPLGHRDERWWGDHLADGVRRLVVDDRSGSAPARHGTRAVWAAPGPPGQAMGLRSGSSHEVRIAFADGTLVGTVDRSRACDLVHPGAVYLHQGRPTGWCSSTSTTAPPSWNPTTVTSTPGPHRRGAAGAGTESARSVGVITVGLGEVEVTSQVTGYQRERCSPARSGTEELDLLPPSTWSPAGCGGASRRVVPTGDGRPA